MSEQGLPEGFSRDTVSYRRMTEPVPFTVVRPSPRYSTTALNPFWVFPVFTEPRDGVGSRLMGFLWVDEAAGAADFVVMDGLTVGERQQATRWFNMFVYGYTHQWSLQDLFTRLLDPQNSPPGVADSNQAMAFDSMADFEGYLQGLQQG